MSHRFPTLVSANAKMLRRDRSALFFSLFFPLVFMLVFGLIFGKGNRSKIDVDVVGSGPLATAVARSGTVKLHPRPSAAVAIKRVKDGKEAGALIVSGNRGTLYYSNADLVQGATLRGIVNGVADAVNLRAAARPPLVTLEAQAVESSKLGYIDYLVPGLLAMALSQSAVFGVAAALVSYRERGILRRLRVTPLPLWEFSAARVLTQLGLALGQTAVLLLAGRVLFDVHIVGNIASLLPLVILGALCFIMIGFLVGAVSKSQQAAAALANVITLPMVFLAGVFFPLAGAPGWLQAVGHVLPLTYLANGLRDVAVRGHSFASTFGDLLVLLGVTSALALLSVRIFRWDSD
jgi:ABC-2 type transport system permease protein